MALGRVLRWCWWLWVVSRMALVTMGDTTDDAGVPRMVLVAMGGPREVLVAMGDPTGDAGGPGWCQRGASGPGWSQRWHWWPWVIPQMMLVVPRMVLVALGGSQGGARGHGWSQGGAGVPGCIPQLQPPVPTVFAQPIVSKAKPELLRSHFIPTMEKLKKRAGKVVAEEEQLRMEAKTEGEDAELLIRDEFSVLCRDLYALYPLLIRYVDNSR